MIPAGEMSLETAYGIWVGGKVDALTARKWAASLECECGNGGVSCWWSVHQEMREKMMAISLPEEPSAEEIVMTCANCGKNLNQKQCKLVCECGYFASCSDYY